MKICLRCKCNCEDQEFNDMWELCKDCNDIWIEDHGPITDLYFKCSHSAEMQTKITKMWALGEFE